MRRSLATRLVAASLAACALASCGKMADLQPAAGQPLPTKPLMARSTPTPNELLTAPAYANPDRVDELITKSAPRTADRFDLPPPSGQAPEVPAPAIDEQQANTAAPVTAR